MTTVSVERYIAALDNIDSIQQVGKVSKIIGLLIESQGPRVNLGDLCYITSPEDGFNLPAEVVGFRESRVLLMPLGEFHGIGPGCQVVSARKTLKVKVGRGLLGRIIDGLGNPIDGKGPLNATAEYPLHAVPPPALARQRIDSRISVGIRAVDGMLTIGRGQRMGIMAGSGVGKSTLLGMVARNTDADVSVIALVGERGREVREFIERDLGEEGMRRSVVVVATSDQPPILRLKGAFVATAIAEYFRDQGLDVMLTMDSVTRLAWAQREVGLAIGEPPTTRGYTPSVFAMLPQLLERAGAGQRGTITGLYTVLVEGDDMNEPVADTVRGILDGHIVLARKLAEQGQYPAVDPLQSVSRSMPDLVDDAHRQAAVKFRDLLATYRGAEDLINIGAYVEGSNRRIDEARTRIGDMQAFLRQRPDEPAPWDSSLAALRQAAGEA